LIALLGLTTALRANAGTLTRRPPGYPRLTANVTGQSQLGTPSFQQMLEQTSTCQASMTALAAKADDVDAGCVRVHGLFHLLHGDHEPCVKKLIVLHRSHDVGVQADVVSKTTVLARGGIHATIEKELHPVTVITVVVAVLERFE
jgi:hypothetical protein